MEKITKKAGFIIAAAILLIITLAGLIWALSDEKQVLFSGLSEATLVEYTAKLEAEGIGYQVEDSNIWVLSSEANKARVIAMQDSIHTSQITGLELYENSDLGATERAQQANYIRALQGEIERTLTAFSYVKKARVHLSLPKRRLFAQKTEQAKASVTLFAVDNYQPRQIDIDSIKHLVASAVETLSVDQVVVLDGAGNWGRMQSDNSQDSPALSLRKSTEAYLEKKVYQVLLPLFSAEKVAASVAVQMDTNKVKTLQTKPIKAANGNGLINTEISTEETRPNSPEEQGNQSNRKEIVYAHGSLTEETEQTPGKIMRLSAAVSINAEVAPELQLSLTQLIEQALGMDSARGDKVSVKFFNIPPKTQPVVSLPASKPVATQAQPEVISWPLYLVALGALFSLLSTYIFLTRKREQKQRVLINKLNALFEQREAGHE